MTTHRSPLRSAREALDGLRSTVLTRVARVVEGSRAASLEEQRWAARRLLERAPTDDFAPQREAIARCCDRFDADRRASTRAALDPWSEGETADPLSLACRALRRSAVLEAAALVDGAGPLALAAYLLEPLRGAGASRPPGDEPHRAQLASLTSRLLDGSADAYHRASLELGLAQLHAAGAQPSAARAALERASAALGALDVALEPRSLAPLTATLGALAHPSLAALALRVTADLATRCEDARGFEARAAWRAVAALAARCAPRLVERFEARAERCAGEPEAPLHGHASPLAHLAGDALRGRPFDALVLVECYTAHAAPALTRRWRALEAASPDALDAALARTLAQLGALGEDPLVALLAPAALAVAPEALARCESPAALPALLLLARSEQHPQRPAALRALAGAPAHPRWLDGLCAALAQGSATDPGLSSALLHALGAHPSARARSVLATAAAQPTGYLRHAARSALARGR